MEFRTAIAGGQRFVFGEIGQGDRSCCSTASRTRRRAGRRRRERLSAAGYRAIVPYLRGYHRDTIVPGRGYGSRQIGEDAILLLDALGLDRRCARRARLGRGRRLPGRRAGAGAPARAVRRGDPAPAKDQPLARAAVARAALHHAAPAERPVAGPPQRLRLPRRADAPLGAALVGSRARRDARRRSSAASPTRTCCTPRSATTGTRARAASRASSRCRR